MPLLPPYPLEPGPARRCPLALFAPGTWWCAPADQVYPAAAAAAGHAGDAGHRPAGGSLLADFLGDPGRTIQAFLIAAVVGVPLACCWAATSAPTAASSS